VKFYVKLGMQIRDYYRVESKDSLTSREVYVSTDIEVDGEVPGKNSMLSIGSAAYLADKTLLSTFSINLEVLPEAIPDPVTMRWWQGFPDAWQTCQENLVSLDEAGKEKLPQEWKDNLPHTHTLPGKPIE